MDDNREGVDSDFGSLITDVRIHTSHFLNLTRTPFNVSISDEYNFESQHRFVEGGIVFDTDNEFDMAGPVTMIADLLFASSMLHNSEKIRYNDCFEINDASSVSSASDLSQTTEFPIHERVLQISEYEEPRLKSTEKDYDYSQHLLSSPSETEKKLTTEVSESVMNDSSYSENYLKDRVVANASEMLGEPKEVLTYYKDFLPFDMRHQFAKYSVEPNAQKTSTSVDSQSTNARIVDDVGHEGTRKLRPSAQQLIKEIEYELSVGSLCHSEIDGVRTPRVFLSYRNHKIRTPISAYKAKIVALEQSLCELAGRIKDQDAEKSIAAKEMMEVRSALMKAKRENEETLNHYRDLVIHLCSDEFVNSADIADTHPSPLTEESIWRVSKQMDAPIAGTGMGSSLEHFLDKQFSCVREAYDESLKLKQSITDLSKIIFEQQDDIRNRDAQLKLFQGTQSSKSLNSMKLFDFDDHGGNSGDNGGTVVIPKLNFTTSHEISGNGRSINKAEGIESLGVRSDTSQGFGRSIGNNHGRTLSDESPLIGVIQSECRLNHVLSLVPKLSMNSFQPNYRREDEPPLQMSPVSEVVESDASSNSLSDQVSTSELQSVTGASLSDRIDVFGRNISESEIGLTGEKTPVGSTSMKSELVLDINDTSRSVYSREIMKPDPPFPSTGTASSEDLQLSIDVRSEISDKRANTCSSKVECSNKSHIDNYFTDLNRHAESFQSGPQNETVESFSKEALVHVEETGSDAIFAECLIEQTILQGNADSRLVIPIPPTSFKYSERSDFIHETRYPSLPSIVRHIYTAGPNIKKSRPYSTNENLPRSSLAVLPQNRRPRGPVRRSRSIAGKFGASSFGSHPRMRQNRISEEMKSVSIPSSNVRSFGDTNPKGMTAYHYPSRVNNSTESASLSSMGKSLAEAIENTSIIVKSPKCRVNSRHKQNAFSSDAIQHQFQKSRTQKTDSFDRRDSSQVPLEDESNHKTYAFFRSKVIRGFYKIGTDACDKDCLALDAISSIPD